MHMVLAYAQASAPSIAANSLIKAPAHPAPLVLEVEMEAETEMEMEEEMEMEMEVEVVEVARKHLRSWESTTLEFHDHGCWR